MEITKDISQAVYFATRLKEAELNLEEAIRHIKSVTHAPNPLNDNKVLNDALDMLTTELMKVRQNQVIFYLRDSVK